MLKPSGNNIIIDNTINQEHATSSLTKKAKVVSVGNRVISVSPGNVIRYLPVDVPVGTKMNYLVISEEDIISIEEEFL